MDKLNKPIILPALVAVIMLLAAIPNYFEYNYYILLRWVITGISIYTSIYFFRNKNESVSFLFGVLVFAFNPILPLYLDKSLWVVIDVLGIVLFSISLYKKEDKYEMS